MIVPIMEILRTPQLGLDKDGLAVGVTGRGGGQVAHREGGALPALSV